MPRRCAQAITPNTCAFLVEPIQGEAGIVIPPKGFLKEAAEICRQNRVLLMADEIQSGLGRTGKALRLHARRHQARLLIVGKALAGGFYPVSAVLSSKEILGVFNPGDHGSTFGGNPLGCAVARTALRVLVEEKMVERSAELGAYFLQTAADPEQPRGEGSPRDRACGSESNCIQPARPYCEALKEEGCAVQGDARSRDPHCAAVDYQREEIDWAFERIRRVIEGK